MSSNKGAYVLHNFDDPKKPWVLPGKLFGHVDGIQKMDQVLARASELEPSDPLRDRGYGEGVFNTSMTGYQEILTDPSYYGEIVTFTNPHIGNTGVNPEDVESKKIWCAGMVINELCEHPSNWRSTQSLDDYLKHYQVPGISEVDTRFVTRTLRIRGAAPALILPEHLIDRAAELLGQVPEFEGRNLVQEVTCRGPMPFEGNPSGGGKYRVAAVNFGMKTNILRSLAERGCEVQIFPANTPASEIVDFKPDGVFLSNGPGDPSAVKNGVECVRELLGQFPIFGICMGHQILSLALGGKTYKLKFGHRGGNQPVQDHLTSKVEISSHNHGYSVDEASLPKGVEVTHRNLNDKTVEGIQSAQHQAFSVQYHPEACPGPHDSRHLFDRFIQGIESWSKNS